MKTASISDSANPSSAAANRATTNGVAVPDVTSREQARKDDGVPVEEEPAPAQLEIPVMLDMNDDEEDEPHILFIDLNEHMLWLHSDTQTLEAFLRRKRGKDVVKKSPILTKLLDDIAAAAEIVHAGRYSTLQPVSRVNTKGKTLTMERVAPNKQQRDEAILQLKEIKKLLEKLNKESAVVMKKQRPPSHKVQVETIKIDGDLFCAKVVMAPLSILPRDDGVVGSSPTAASTLFSSLTSRIGYKRGHMLNEHLHGPGTADNLVPISTAFNSVMKVGVEKIAKEAVNANNKVISFEAEPLDWGQYPGYYNGSFPDEQKLPNRFRFLVKQLTRIAGTDGSDITHWQEKGSPLYDRTETHTIPSVADVVKGTIAPGVQTFKPGYYRSHDGKLDLAANLNYHLSGTYTFNNPSFSPFFDAFGLGPVKLANETLPLEVTTEFEVPAGLSLVPIPQGEMEFIDHGKVLKRPTPIGLSFVIVDVSERNRNLAVYSEMIEDKKNKQQRKELSGQEQKEKEAKILKERQVASARSAQANNNSHVIINLERAFNDEANRYSGRFKGVFLERFNAMKEDILVAAKAEWEMNDELRLASFSRLLEIQVNRFYKEKDFLVKEQDFATAATFAKKQFANGLVQELKGTISQFSSGLTENWQKDKFDADAGAIFSRYRKYWEDPRNTFDKNKRQEMLDSAVSKIRTLLAHVKKIDPPAASAKRKFEPLPEKKTDSHTQEEEEEEEEDTRGEKESERKKFRKDTGAFIPTPHVLSTAEPRQPDIPPFQPLVPRKISERQALETASTVSGWIIGLQQRFDGDKETQSQLATLLESIQQFMARPGRAGWENVSQLLNKLLSLAPLHAHLVKPFSLWERIKPY